MNYKLEKFWKFGIKTSCPLSLKWTINLKSFEKLTIVGAKAKCEKWTINLKSFEKRKVLREEDKENMNYKLEKFWNYISGNSTPVSIKNEL